MLGLGFYLSFLLLEREFKLRDIDPELAYKILLLAIPCGIVGSKIFHILEHIDQFLIDPVNMIFSGSGLSALGGYVMALLLGIILIKKNNENLLNVFDASSPSMALGYCFGRFGCHVAGDGCYGVNSLSSISVSYPNGIVPTSTPVYPTPFFEVFVSFITVGILLKLRKKDLPTGFIFFTFLIISGLSRFMVEFFRRNPKMIFSLTQAQVIGISFILIGIIGYFYASKKQAEA